MSAAATPREFALDNLKLVRQHWAGVCAGIRSLPGVEDVFSRDQIAAPLDLAPTLAFLAGVTLPRAEGRILNEALFVTSPRPYVPQVFTSAH
jgi:hypothetical protein